MNTLEALYNHYEDTCNIQRNNLEQRNHFFTSVAILLGSLGLLALDMDNIIISLLNKELEIDITPFFGICKCLLWLLLLDASICYFQTSISIERTYKYIHRLEKKISGETDFQFNREVGHYLMEYPLCDKLIDLWNKWFFPILYIILVAANIISEIEYSWEFAFNCTVAVIAVILCILYMKFNHGFYTDYSVWK